MIVLFKEKRRAGNQPAFRLLPTASNYGVGVGGCVPAAHWVFVTAGTANGGGQTSAVLPVPLAGCVVAVPITAPAAGAGVQPFPSQVASNSAEKLGEACMFTTTQFCVVLRSHSAGPKPTPSIPTPRWNVSLQSAAPVPLFARLRNIQPASGATPLGLLTVIAGGKGKLADVGVLEVSGKLAVSSPVVGEN